MTSVLRSIQMGNFNVPHYQKIMQFGNASRRYSGIASVLCLDRWTSGHLTTSKYHSYETIVACMGTDVTFIKIIQLLHLSRNTLATRLKISQSWQMTQLKDTNFYCQNRLDMGHFACRIYVSMGLHLYWYEFFAYLIRSTAINFLHCIREIEIANVIHTGHCQE